MALIVASTMLGGTALLFHQLRTWREQAELHRCTAMAEVYATQVSAMSARSPAEVGSLVKNLDWHPASRLLAVLDGDGAAVVVRGDQGLLATCVDWVAGHKHLRGPMRTYLPGEAAEHVPATALSVVPVIRSGEKTAVGVLVYAVRAAEPGMIGDEASVWRSVGAMGVVSCLGAFLGLCLLRYSVLEPLRGVLHGAGLPSPSTTEHPVRGDEIERVAGLMTQLQANLQQSRARITQLETGVERRVHDETHKMSVQLRQVERKVWLDPLSRLGNRRMLDERLEQLFVEQRRAGAQLAVVMLDVDHFKTLNDTLGHKAGDELITFIGELLSHSVRENDLAIRYGGDEFLLVLPGVSGEKASTIAERIVRLFGQHARLLLTDPRPSMSAGVASLREHKPASSAAFLQMADQALYLAKSSGKACVCVYRPGSMASVAAS